MRYTGLHATSEYELEDGDSNATQSFDFNKTSMFTGYRQIICQINVLLLVTVNCCTTFHVVYIRNFLIIVADNLLPNHIFPDLARTMLYGSVFVVPQICVLVMSHVVKQFGAFKVCQITFYIKIVSSATMYAIGPHHSWILASFILTDSSITIATGQYFDLLMSDCIDEDMKTYNKRSPRSSMFYGMNALFVKPTQSLAPMLVLAILSRSGYESGKDEMASDPDDILNLHEVMFQIVCFVPLILGLIQTLIWTKYSLRDSHLDTKRLHVV
uniref:Uncharacterized protein LOC100371444 n=1 Tax=Saccoglossus kowalevskii TaxID=10224 RepID=A0ABM0LU61_SACKO|nr:PREDICTED: uncharacterized protein LOC100371444 [Saccoglossus kowalevskii]